MNDIERNFTSSKLWFYSNGIPHEKAEQKNSATTKKWLGILRTRCDRTKLNRRD